VDTLLSDALEFVFRHDADLGLVVSRAVELLSDVAQFTRCDDRCVGPISDILLSSN